MARPGVTYEQVAEAADKLDSDGIRPSPTKVREALGNTGSYSTIARFLKDWEEAR